MKNGLLTEYRLKQSKVAEKAVKRLLQQPISLHEARLQVLKIKKQSRSTVKKGHS